MVIRKGYPHCGYMAAHTREYVEEIGIISIALEIPGLFYFCLKQGMIIHKLSDKDVWARGVIEFFCER